jgi:hypothetical protein
MRVAESRAASAMIAADDRKAACKPVVNALASSCDRCVVPTKIANARPRGMERADTNIATAKEKTIPTFANVRNMPDAIPNCRPGTAFMTADWLAGKNPPPPMPFTTAAATTSQRAVRVPSCE